MSSSNHRKFFRADFQTQGYIHLSDNKHIPFELINISLKGILLNLKDSVLEKGEAYDLRIKLMSSDIEINTISVLVHERGR